MPREQANFNSSRIQRAYRINNIEQSRLLNRLQLLDKERVHENRMTNQDIRLITITLDYIQSSSGNSPESIGPVEETGKNPAAREELQPCFMYGERTASRRFGKFRRVKSAACPRKREDDDDSVSSSGSTMTGSCGTGRSRSKVRPQSSPGAGSQWTNWTTRSFSTYSNQSDSAESDSDKEDEDRELRLPSRVPTAPRLQNKLSTSGWSNPLNYVTKPKENINNKTAVCCRTAPAGGQRTRFNDNLTDKQNEEDTGFLAKNQTTVRRSRLKKPVLHARNSKLAQVVNQVRVMTMAARTWRATANQNYLMASYTPASSRRHYETKLEINKERKLSVDAKVEAFMSKLPRPPSTVQKRRNSVTSVC